MTLDVAGFIPQAYGLGGGGLVTITRDGNVYVAPQGGIGVPGFGVVARAGWIGGPWGSGVTDHSDIDSFVQGWSVTASGEITPVGAGETWGHIGDFGHNDFATEVGLGYGAGAGVTANYAFHAFDLPISW